MTLNKKTICFDLDNVICKTLGNDYKSSLPIKKNIKVVNRLYKKGNYIKIFTARFMGRTNDNAKKAKKLAEKITKYQLKKWNVNYHKLIFGKPSYDIYIDDKSFFFDKNWSKKLTKKLL